MDPNFRIYQAPEDQIPPEDKARLDGYLHAKSEEYEKRAMAEIVKNLEAEVREMIQRKEGQ